MWIPKTDEELKKLLKEKEKTARITGLTGTLTVIIILIVDAKYIGVKIEKFPIPLTQPIFTWTQIFNSLPGISMFGLIVGIFGYLGMRKIRLITTLICPKCKRIKGYDKVRDCSCGGHFVFLDEMNWIEDEKPENDETKENT